MPRNNALFQLLILTVLAMAALPARAVEGASFNFAQLIPGGGFTKPMRVAVDSSGNLYVSDYGGDKIVMLKSSGSYSSSSAVTIVSITEPNGLTVDSQGDVFVTSAKENEVYEIASTGTVGSFPSSPAASELASGNFSYPNGVAVDSSGNVYVADSSHNELKEILAVSGTIPASSPTVNTLDSDLYWPTSVVLGNGGNIYVSDSYNSREVQLQTQAVNFGKIALASTSSSIPLTFTVISVTSLGAPVALTQGASGLDFAVSSGGTCTSGSSYGSSGSTCTVDVTFTPKAAGTRPGAVELLDSSGNLLTTVFVYGTGLGPQIAFVPGATTVLGGGFSDPMGIAVDGSGDIFVADMGNMNLDEMASSCGSASCVTTLDSGIYALDQIALDGAGNMISAETGTQDNVREFLANGKYQVAEKLAASFGFVDPFGAAVDEEGNVFIADDGSNVVYEILAQGGYTTVNKLAGFGDPGGVAVDANGNVFVSDISNNSVNEIVAVNGSIPASPTILTLSTDFNAPMGLTVDDLGNVFVADDRNKVIKEIYAVNGSVPSSPTVATVVSGLTLPKGVAIDQAGSLYVADDVSGGSGIFKLDEATVPSLTFATATSAGSTDTNDGTLTVTIQNNGNQQLSFSSITASTNFTIDTSKTTCSTSSSLASGLSCVVGVTFTPQSSASGKITGNLVLTDNTLNAAGTTQQIALNGTVATALINTTTVLQASQQNVTVGTSVTLTATVTPASGSGVPTGTVTFNDQFNGATTTLGTGTLNSSGTATYTASSLAAGSHSITASYGGDTNNAASTSTATTVTVTAAAAPSFTLGSSTGSQTVKAGSTATYIITVTPQNGSFSSAITFSATGLPSGAQASFQPQTVTPGGSATSTTLTIQTATTQSDALGWGAPGLLALVNLLVLLLLPGRRARRLFTQTLLLLVALAAFGILSGCGGKSSSSAKSYTVTVTGTSGSNVQTTTVTLTVK